MKRDSWILRGTLGAAAWAALSAAGQADIVATRTIVESLPASGAPPRVVVDNVFGSIRVTAHDTPTIELNATETIRGDLQSDVDRAREEVELRIDRDATGVAFRVRNTDGTADSACGCSRWQDYRVEYDIELTVPRDAALDLSTVNGGRIEVAGVHGDFEISNVNGPVHLEGLRGAGRVETVNGELRAAFERAPIAATSFKTVNGDIEVTFPDALAADLQFKSMRGQIYTDFEAQPIPGRPAAATERRGATLLARMQHDAAVRIGAGGPLHAFETLNGDVRIRRGGR